MGWPPHENSIDLSGEWELVADSDDCGLAEQWWRNSPPDGEWKPIGVPCAWQTVLGPDDHGVAWYRRVIQLPKSWRGGDDRQRLWLRFESVATDCTVWINRIEIGRHVGDYVPFQLEITEAVAETERCEIVIRVDEIHAPPPECEGDLQNGHITKGFHDVISLQHGGIWQPAHLARTLGIAARPDGVSVVADPVSGEVRIDIELERELRRQALEASACVSGPDETLIDERLVSVDPGRDRVSITLVVPEPQMWSPNAPTLYTARVDLLDDGEASERHHVRFGFRRIEPVGRRILLNGRPLLIRGVLDWGHEPQHIAPAPTADEIRDRLTHLTSMGFNCVCLCMWYPPRCFYDIADELGMLIWQEHPVWQSPMNDADLPEYRRLYKPFMRRDRNHPSVIIVSATCEHPSFHPELADWWWRTARRMLPDRLLELQTAFFKWADPERTDLHDEHTYDNSNRWVSYLDDVEHHLRDLPAKPFVMGETILFTSWPDTNAIIDCVGGDRPWWLPKAFEDRRRFEDRLLERYGVDVLERFRRQGDRFHLLGRKFQVERFRDSADRAGVVMNHLRDVPACLCGFIDDLDRWRFAPEQMRGWLGARALLLLTPNHRRGFAVSRLGAAVPCRIALSNFATDRFAGVIELECRLDSPDGPLRSSLPMNCTPGEVAALPIELSMSHVEKPTRFEVVARAEDAHQNAWDLWSFPTVDDWPDGVVRMSGLPFDPADAEPDEVERGYSRGYGLPVRNWTIALPDPAVLAPKLPSWDAYVPPPVNTHAVLTHKLTRALVDFLTAGGRVVLLASKSVGGLGTRYEWLFGGVPLVIEEGPIHPGDSEWIIDLLGYDLTRRYCRVIPVEELGIADHVDPLIRLVYTHDQDRVRFFDFVFQARVGDGLLIVSSLDHGEDAGRFLLHGLLRYAASGEAMARSAIDSDVVRGWAVKTIESTARPDV
jgi:hypothetical protein